MSRLNCPDKRPRKQRSDIGKKRKNYAGKPCKHITKRDYKKVKGHKTQIKIWVWKIEPMTEDGRKRWNKYIRNKVSHEVWIPQNKNHVYLVDVQDINNREKLGQFISDRYYKGTFAVMGFTNKKNKYHCSPKAKAIIVIGENDEGNYVKSFKDRSMYRYWFWEKS